MGESSAGGGRPHRFVGPSLGLNPPGGAEGDGDRIRDVGRGGELPQPALEHHRVLHLLLAGVAETGDRLLDLAGRKLIDGDAMLGGGEEDHAPGVPHEHRRPGVAVVAEDLLDDHFLRVERSDDGRQILVQLPQAALHGLAALQPNDACINEQGIRRGRVDPHAAIAGEVKPGINAEDPHDAEVIGSSRRIR